MSQYTIQLDRASRSAMRDSIMELPCNDRNGLFKESEEVKGVGETQYPADMYRIRTLRKDEGRLQQRGSPISPGSDSARSEPTHSSVTAYGTTVEKREEATVNIGALNIPPYNPGSLENWDPVLDLGNQFPGRNGNDPSFPAVAGGGQRSFACSSPACQPRKPGPVAKERKEEFPNRYLTDTVAYPDSPPQYDFPASSSNGRVGPAGPGLTLHPTNADLAFEKGNKVIVVDYTPNIVFLGESGVGKASVINLIADQKLASSDALDRVFQYERYPIKLGKMSYTLWDITGLDEAFEGTVPPKQVETNLKQLIRELSSSGNIHLIICCTHGTQLTMAFKRNYDLFYTTLCQKKAHIALVVTGLENEKREMETWWTMNEAVLRRNGMHFDAHACVTTLDVENHVIQQRRLNSRTLLHELVIKYSGLPGWKIDPSSVSRVSPVFRSRVASSAGNLGTTATIRRVAVCSSFNEFLPGVTAVSNKSMGKIGDMQYEFFQLDKHALNTFTPKTLEDIGGMGAGLLVFYTVNLVDNHMPLTDIDALKRFYDVAGGQTRPVIVALRGCNDEQAAWACKVEVASRHCDIHAHFFRLSGTDDARAKLDELIESFCIQQVEAKAPNLFKKYLPRGK